MDKTTLFGEYAGGLAVLVGVLFMLTTVGCAGRSKPVTSATLAPGEEPILSPGPSADARIPGLSQSKRGFEQPAQPDPAFVQGLIDVFDRIQNKAVRHLAQERVVDQVFIDHQRALYAPEWLDLSLNAWRIQKDVLKPDPGQARTTVGEVVTWKKGCIVAAVDANYAAWFSIEQEPLPQRYIVVTPRPEPVPQGLNPTGWWMRYNGFEEDGSLPGDVCGG